MKKLQCTKCEQVFWTEVAGVDENLVGFGEWIQCECPKCEEEWSFLAPGLAKIEVPRRKRRPASKGRGRKAKVPIEKVEAGLGPKQIRALREKLGLSQKELSSVMGVSLGSVGLWEKGKFRPKAAKITQLAELGKLDKEGVRKLLAEKVLKPPEEKKPEEAPAGKAKGKRKRPMRRKAVRIGKGKKA
jgi:transcriptional regulator with XRE-family HTH domain